MTPIRTLIIKDSEVDALFLLAQLRRGKFDPTYERVDSAERFSQALGRQTWDIIFCDLSLGQFDLAEAVRMVRERGLSLPFIVVAGVEDEAMRTSALEAGANDFISKGQAERLISSVGRELREYRLNEQFRRAMASLRRSELRFHLFYEQAPLPYQVLDAEGYVEDINPAWLNLLGFSREQVLGRWFGSFLLRGQADLFRQQLAELQRAEALKVEFLLTDAHGGGVKVIAYGRTVPDEQGCYAQSCWLMYEHSWLERAREPVLPVPASPPDTGAPIPSPSSLMPICMSCKKIRDQSGGWHPIEAFIKQHVEVEFTHGVCPDCIPKLFPDLTLDRA